MIGEYPTPEYYIENLNIDIEPRIGDTVVGSVVLDSELDKPDLLADPEGFKCKSEMLFTLYLQGEEPWERNEDDDEIDPFGNIEIKFEIFLAGSHEKYEEHYQSWEENGYHAIDDDFIHHLESGILQEVVTPIGELLSDTYNGLIPRMRFSEPPESEVSTED